MKVGDIVRLKKTANTAGELYDIRMWQRCQDILEISRLDSTSIELLGRSYTKSGDVRWWVDSADVILVEPRKLSGAAKVSHEKKLKDDSIIAIDLTDKHEEIQNTSFKVIEMYQAADKNIDITLEFDGEKYNIFATSEALIKLFPKLKGII